MNFPKRIQQKPSHRNPSYPAPTNQTTGVAEPLTCAWLGLPLEAPGCRLHRQDPMVSKGKISAAQATQQVGLEPRQGRGQVWEGVLPVGWVRLGCFREEACRLRRADGETSGRAQGQHRAIPPLPAVRVPGSPSPRVLELRAQPLTMSSVASPALPDR